jgi:hypothetical protein
VNPAVKAVLAVIAILVALVLGVALGVVLSEDEDRPTTAETSPVAPSQQEIELLASATACSRIKADSPCPVVSSLRRVGERFWTFRVALDRNTTVCYLLDSAHVSMDLIPAAVRGVRRTACI